MAAAIPPRALTPRSRVGITCAARTALLERSGATDRLRAELGSVQLEELLEKHSRLSPRVKPPPEVTESAGGKNILAPSTL